MILVILTEQYSLTKTRQRVEYTDIKGKVAGRTFLVIGPAYDGTWMIKEHGTAGWDYVDTEGQCHNHFYDGRTRPVQELELRAYEQHKAELSQDQLF